MFKEHNLVFFLCSFPLETIRIRRRKIFSLETYKLENFTPEAYLNNERFITRYIEFKGWKLWGRSCIICTHMLKRKVEYGIKCRITMYSIGKKEMYFFPRNKNNNLILTLSTKRIIIWFKLWYSLRLWPNQTFPMSFNFKIN